MYLQVKNSVQAKFNTIRSTKETLMQDIKRQGWNIQDCSVSEIRAELVDTKYRGADGKNIPAGKKQYKTRATRRGNLNKTNVHVVQKVEAIVS